MNWLRYSEKLIFCSTCFSNMTVFSQNKKRKKKFYQHFEKGFQDSEFHVYSIIGEYHKDQMKLN